MTVPRGCSIVRCALGVVEARRPSEVEVGLDDTSGRGVTRQLGCKAAIALVQLN
jgi:hypothetical protein